MAKDQHHADPELEVERSYEPDDERIRRALELLLRRAPPPADSEDPA